MSQPADPAEAFPVRLRRPPPDPAKVRRNYRLGLATVAVTGAAALGLLAFPPTTTITTQDRPDGAWLEVVARDFRDESRTAVARQDARGVATIAVPTRDVRGLPVEWPQVSLTRKDGTAFAVHAAPSPDAELVAALERWLADPKAGFTTTRANRSTMVARQLAYLLGLIGALGAYLAWMSRSLLRQLEVTGRQ